MSQGSGTGEVRAALERLSLTAPAGPVAENLTALPDLLRTEAEATASYLNDAREYALLLPDNYSSTDAARSVAAPWRRRQPRRHPWWCSCVTSLSDLG